jgi:hypothetical protein
LDRRHDETDKDKSAAAERQSFTLTEHAIVRKQRQIQPIVSDIFFWLRKPTGLFLMIIMTVLL